MYIIATFSINVKLNLHISCYYCNSNICQWDLVLFVSSRRTQLYNQYSKWSSYEKNKIFLINKLHL